MKQILFWPVMLVAIVASAQVDIKGDERIGQLMNAYEAYNRKNDGADGFRLQLYFSNDRQEIYGYKAKVYRDFPNEKLHIIYEAPSYKLRMGDYQNRFQLARSFHQVILKYPGAFVVRDWVKIR